MFFLLFLLDKKDPDSYFVLMDPDPGGQKTKGSGSRSPTLVSCKQADSKSRGNYSG
jgi:hypothetical protein